MVNGGGRHEFIGKLRLGKAALSGVCPEDGEESALAGLMRRLLHITQG